MSTLYMYKLVIKLLGTIVLLRSFKYVLFLLTLVQGIHSDTKQMYKTEQKTILRETQYKLVLVEVR